MSLLVSLLNGDTLTTGNQTMSGVKTFSSVPLGTAETWFLSLPTITAIAGGAKAICSAPYAGTITGVKAIIDGAITATDIVITTKINGTGVTNGIVTVANAASALGTVATATPTALNTFAAGDAITCTITGGVGAVGGTLTLYVTRTS